MTGEKVLFHWWLSDFAEDGSLPAGEGGKPLIDVFEEDDHMVVVFEVPPSVTVSGRVKVEQRHDILSIRLDKLR
ncbi:MAG: hypothetical protein QHH06_08805 [Clostridiales bacterium]|nr:hypothetical protein [Eubacteriales bacterium]MDH7566564.1 hypothetical protein [Clostridiales bacterium]